MRGAATGNGGNRQWRGKEKIVRREVPGMKREGMEESLRATNTTDRGEDERGCDWEGVVR